MIPRRIRTLAIPVLLIALPALAVGCGGDGAGGSATPGAATPTDQEPVGTSGPTLTPAPDIKDVDFGANQALNDFLAAAGEVFIREIRYVDLTGDGVADAMLPISSLGEGGDIAVFVFGYGPDGLQEMLRVVAESGTITAEVLNGVLVTIEPLYAPGDPMCCPSQTRARGYGLEESVLVPVFERITGAQ